MSWLPGVAGTVLVALTLRDVFYTLWSPGGNGSLSRWWSRALWRVAHRFGPGALQVAGPAVLVCVIVTWGAAVVAGFALLYSPHLPDGFLYAGGLDVAERGGVVDALYLSSVVLGTLGFGDIVPTADGPRLLTALEGLIGFGLLTAGVSWVQQVSPVLARRRALAVVLTHIHRLHPDPGAGAPPEPDLLRHLALEIAAIRVGLHQFDQTYYFRDRDTTEAPSAVLPYAWTLAQSGLSSPTDAGRESAALLDVALRDLAGVLADRFVPGPADPSQVFTRYAHDHRHTPLGAPTSG